MRSIGQVTGVLLGLALCVATFAHTFLASPAGLPVTDTLDSLFCVAVIVWLGRYLHDQRRRGLQREPLRASASSATTGIQWGWRETRLALAVASAVLVFLVVTPAVTLILPPLLSLLVGAAGASLECGAAFVAFQRKEGTGSHDGRVR